MEEEKDLEGMTATQLREEAKKIEGVASVHAMKKEELIEVVRKARGLPGKRVRAGAQDLGIGGIKARMRALKLQRQEALSSGDKKRVGFLKEKIRRSKRQTRKLAKRASK